MFKRPSGTSTVGGGGGHALNDGRKLRSGFTKSMHINKYALYNS